jgi:hypothetical protein
LKPLTSFGDVSGTDRYPGIAGWKVRGQTLRYFNLLSNRETMF